MNENDEKVTSAEEMPEQETVQNGTAEQQPVQEESAEQAASQNENDVEETVQSEPEVKPEKPMSKSKAWRKYKKEKRAAKREALKKEYEQAPALIRIFRLYILKPLIWIAVILLVVGGIFAYLINSGTLNETINQIVETDLNAPVDEEKIYAASPIDEDGAKRIDSIPAYDEDDTWTICVYMIGSNLESLGEDDLSEVTTYLTSGTNSSNTAAMRQKYRDYITKFVSEIGEKNMTLPDYFFIPTSPVASIDYEYSEVIATDMDGFASSDLSEMMSADFGDNIKIVVQTGGANRWSNPLINPNKTQRFEISSGRITEVANMSLQDSCSVDTLADFLSFCKQNYKSDHKILLFWDHGDGAFGYGSDEIFGSSFSNADIREALSKVYDESPENPTFELIGFDACLMANMEACHELYGYGKYLAASEELEPGAGWDHTAWLNAFASDGATNGAKIGMNIADAYTNYYITRNINQEGYSSETSVAFSVIDINKAETVYEKYCDLVKDILIASTDDQSVLASIGRAGSRSVVFGQSSYNVINHVDICTFMDQLVATDLFAEKSTEVKNAVADAVLYHRQNGYLADSTGMSLYFPVEVSTLSGLAYYLDYINSISDDESIKALYYYKVGGCLNDELTDYAKTIGCDDVPVLDVEPLNNISKLNVKIENGNYSVALNEETENMIQKYQMTLAKYDDENGIITYLGNDNYAYLDGDGNLETAFEGKWISMDGQMLSLEIVDEAPSSIQYRTKVRCNGVDSYLLLTYDKDSEEITISGIRDIPDEYSSDLADISDRNLRTLEKGDVLVPLYDGTDLSTNKSITIEGDGIRYGKNTTASLQPIENGKYLTYIVVTDARGDEYYTSILEFNYTKDGVEDMQINSDFSIVKTQ